MRVELVERTGGPERLVCEAELIFDSPEDPEQLQGLKLVGFSLWRGTGGEIYVTVPSRAFGAGTERRFFDYLRPIRVRDTDSIRRIKVFINAEYERMLELSAQASVSGPVDAAGHVESVDDLEAQQEHTRPQLPTTLGKPAEQPPVSHKRPRGRASRGKKKGSKSNT